MIFKPRTVLDNTNGLIFTCLMETSRLSCWEICFAATERTMGGRMRKPITA